MEALSAVILNCPNCGEGPHRILRGRASRRSLEAVVRCVSCGQTRRKQIADEGQVDVPVIVSTKGESRRTRIALATKEVLAVGQELYVDDERVVVRALEVSGRRVSSATAGDVDAMWTKLFDKVSVKFAIRIGGRTVHHMVDVDPDEEFSAGDVLVLKGRKAVVFKILTVDGRKTRTAVAKEIKKAYARAIKERWA